MTYKLKEIVESKNMPLCIRRSKVKMFNKSQLYYVSMPHLQTSKHRFRSYPKPISKIINL